jgi:hypothetical protein
VERVICEPCSDEIPIFTGKIQGKLEIEGCSPEQNLLFF